MLRWIVPALLLVPAPVGAARTPLGSDQQARVRCVAVLAIVANEQQRGAGGWDEYPPLAARGAKFSDRVASGLIRGNGRSRDEARDEVLAQVAALQSESATSADGPTAFRDQVKPCIIMLDAEVPPPRSPTLPQCAAALNLAYEDEKAHQGMSKAARTLAVFAAVLEGRARDEMKAAGRTEAESDIAIGLEKEQLFAEFKAHGKKGTQDRIDFQSCFDRARP